MRAIVQMLVCMLLVVGGATAQQVLVPTRPSGDNSNAAASTSFVQAAIAAAIAPFGNAITSLTGDVAATGPGSVASTIQPGVVSNSKLANVAANTIKGSTAGGSPSDLTGAQAESILNFTAAGTGAVQRSVDSKLKDWVSALDFATGNCSTDDSTAIQNAINSLTNGGTVYFPPAPGGCYAIGSGTAITLPKTHAVWLVGAGRSPPQIANNSGTILKASATITNLIKDDGTAFSVGHRITNMSLDGNGTTSTCLLISWTGYSEFDNLDVNNCTVANFQLGTASLNAIENTLLNLRLDNPKNSHSGTLPTYNLDNHSTNNTIIGVLGINATSANIHSATQAANNTYTGVHGYNFDYQSQVATAASTNNFLIEGSGEQFSQWETDGSATANIQVNGNQVILTNGVSTFQSPLTAQIGIQFATGTCLGLVANNTFYVMSMANTIVQAGTPCARGNFVGHNFNQAASAFLGMETEVATGHLQVAGFNATTPTITGGCNGAGSSVSGNDTAGTVVGQTAAATFCTITFAKAWTPSFPRCVVTGINSATTTLATSSTTFTVGFPSTGGFVFNYFCPGT